MSKQICLCAWLLCVFPFLLSSADDLQSLLGKWVFTSEQGSISLEFKNANSLLYDGEPINYELAQGTIRVEDEIFGWIDYPYALEGDVLTISYPEGYSLQFGRVKGKTADADKDKTGANKGGVSTNDLASHFVGTWKNYTQNTETMVVLYPNGTYGYRYTSSYSNAEPGDEWGAAGEQHAQGTWSVQGTREQGVITFTDNDGSQTQYNYQVHVENGEVYWREYYFNGNLYGKNMD